MDFRAYLRTMVEKDASDLYLSSGAPVSAKIDGTLQPLEDGVLTPEQVKDVAWSVMNDEQITEFGHKPEMNLWSLSTRTRNPSSTSARSH